MFGKYEFWTGEYVLSKKLLLLKAAANRRFEYLPLVSKLEKQTDISKSQYKIFKYQINLIDNNREEGVKTEDSVKKEDNEVIDNVGYIYIGDEYKNLIDKTCKYGLVDGDLRISNFDNRIGLSRIVNKN